MRVYCGYIQFRNDMPSIFSFIFDFGTSVSHIRKRVEKIFLGKNLEKYFLNEKINFCGKPSSGLRALGTTENRKMRRRISKPECKERWNRFSPLSLADSKTRDISLVNSQFLSNFLSCHCTISPFISCRSKFHGTSL